MNNKTTMVKVLYLNLFMCNIIVSLVDWMQNIKTVIYGLVEIYDKLYLATYLVNSSSFWAHTWNVAFIDIVTLNRITTTRRQFEFLGMKMCRIWK